MPCMRHSAPRGGCEKGSGQVQREARGRLPPPGDPQSRSSGDQAHMSVVRSGIDGEGVKMPALWRPALCTEGGGDAGVSGMRGAGSIWFQIMSQMWHRIRRRARASACRRDAASSGTDHPSAETCSTGRTKITQSRSDYLRPPQPATIQSRANEWARSDKRNRTR